MRKVLYIVSILLACTLITLVMAVGFLRSSDVQTAVVQLATDEISRALGTQAKIGHIEYQFPARLRLDSIYLSDQQGDTLAYVENIYAHFSPLALREHTLRFRRVSVSGVRANAHRLPDGEYNYAFLIRAFQKNENEDDNQDEDENKEPLTVDLGKLTLSDVAMNYDNHHVQLEELTVPQLVIAADSIYTSAFIRKATYNNEIRLEACELRVATLDTLLLRVQQAQYREFRFSGDFSGRLDSLTATGLMLSHGSDQILDGDVVALGLPNLDSLYIRANCRDFHIRPGRIQDIVSDLTGKPFVLPQPVHRLGNMRYQGLLEGNLADLKLKGAFRTSMGTLTTDGRLSGSSDFSTLGFSGRVASRRFHLGRMLGQREVGDISFALTARGGQSPTRPFYIHGRGEVSEFTYRDYTYRGLQMQVNFEDQQLQAMLHLDDEHVVLSLDALADLSEEKLISAHVRLPRFEPGELSLSEKYPDARLSLSLDAEAYFTDLNDLSGYIHMDSLKWVRPLLNDSDILEELDIQLETDERQRRILLTSELITARLEGEFDYATLGTTFMKLGVKYLPSLFSPAQKAAITDQPSANRFDAYLYGHQWQKWQYLLGLNIRIGDYPVLKAFVDEPNGVWGLQGYVSDVQTRKQQLQNITLSADNHDDRANLALAAQFSGGQYLLQTFVQSDSIHLDLTASGDSSKVRGGIHLASQFSRYNGLPLIDLRIHSSDIQFADSTYHIDPSWITYCMADTLLDIHRFRIGTQSQYVEASGTASRHPEDSIHIALGDIDASYIMPFVVPETTIVVNGRITGSATLYGIFAQPMFACDVILREAGLNNCLLGDAYAKVYLAESGKDIIIDGDVIRPDQHRVAHIDGKVDLRPEAKGWWGLDIRPDSIPLGFISHWTNGIIDNIGGTASGQVEVSGIKGSVWVLAKVLTHEGSMRIPFTGCTYTFSDSCFMDSTSIRFENIHMHDEEGHLMLVNGVLSHECFKKFQFNIGVDVDHALAIHMPDKAGEMIQGKVYASGHVQVVGDEKLVRLDADAKTVGNSRFRLSIDGPGYASDDGFITFVDHNKTNQLNDEKDYGLQAQSKKEERKLPTKFVMGLNIEGTPDLLFQLMLNDKTGDMIQARGEGALRLTYDGSQDIFRLMGTYSILQGDMGFSLAGTFRRNFTIAQGSSIAWNGDPADPTLDVTAKYHVTASLRDLFGSESTTLVTSRTSIPVNTCVSLRGTLNTAQIHFGLELPSSEEAIRTQVLSVINTEEMMMRQVVYLLVFGKFFTPEYMKANAQTTGLNETYLLLSSTLTGQINSWLGKLTDVFTMGVNIRTEGEGSTGQQEYEANFQLQPIPRLIINGNVGYRYNDITNRPFFGDLDVEYMITPNGKVRAKAYTHMVDKYSLRQASTIQGVGFIFRHDFNWPKIGTKSQKQGTKSQEPGTKTEKE